ncbi:hypothetical protein BKA69DRAFT_781545 [Paraphysoderma sedebokerense]|nr:hypothetical protein BKA69DRAFT_781545 [Paraphysoderma sedebokerense]
MQLHLIHHVRWEYCVNHPQKLSPKPPFRHILGDSMSQLRYNFVKDKIFYLNVDLYRLEPRSPISTIPLPSVLFRMPKYQFEGAIIRSYYRQLEPNTYYRVTFTPPFFLKSGNYSVVLSHHSKMSWDDYEAIHLSVQATVSFQRLQLPETKPLGSDGNERAIVEDSSSKRTRVDDSSNKRARVDESSNKRARVGDEETPVEKITSSDNVHLLFNSIDSATTLCSFYSTSPKLRRSCDTLLSESEFPSDLEYPGHATILMKAPANGDYVSKLSTDTVCRLAHVDVLLQKLEFKLLSIHGAQSNTEFDTYSKYKSHLMTRSKGIPPRLSIWTHPNLYYQMGLNSPIDLTQWMQNLDIFSFTSATNLRDI